MNFNSFIHSKKQLLLSITLAILIFSQASVYAADTNLKVDATTGIPPLCTWTTFRSDRIDASNNSFGNIVPEAVGYIPTPWTMGAFGVGWAIGKLFGGTGCEGNDVCYKASGQILGTISGTPILRFGGVPHTGCRPAYCYINQDKMITVPLGSRGDSVCPPLNDVVTFTSSNAGSGSFTISWAANTAEKCTLSGKNPATGKTFSEEFKGDVGAPLQGSRTYDYVQRGI